VQEDFMDLADFVVEGAVTAAVVTTSKSSQGRARMDDLVK
jgi:hypothetical protein